MTKLTQNTFLRMLLALVISGLLAGFVYYIWRFNAPQNTVLNWDIFHHQVVVNEINKGNFSWDPTELSDTFQFQGYFTTFHYVIAQVQTYFPTSPQGLITFWWYAELFHLFAVTLISFVIGWLLYNYRVGVLSAIFGAMVFIPSGAYTNLFLIPQNVSATIGALGIALLIKSLFANSKYKYLLAVLAFSAVLSAILVHFIIGALTIALTVFLLIIKVVSLKFSAEHNIWKVFSLAASATLVIIPLIASQFDLTYINRGEAGFVNFDLPTKIGYMRDAYGFTFLFFLPIGLYFLFKGRKIKEYAIYFIACGFLAVVIAKIPYSLKLYSLGEFYLHLVMAFGLYSLTKQIKTMWFIGIAGLTVAVFTPIFIVNSYKYQQTPKYKHQVTNISPYELDAAEFLYNTYKDKNALLVSDPATMQVLEGTSGINTPGGAYAGIAMRKILEQIYYSQDSNTMDDTLRTIKDGLSIRQPSTHLFAISGRFEKWQELTEQDKMGIHTNIWYPVDITPGMREEYEFLWFVENKTQFKKVFENEGIVIFEI